MAAGNAGQFGPVPLAVCVCACVCVNEGEGTRERGREGGREKGSIAGQPGPVPLAASNSEVTDMVDSSGH